MRGDEEGAGSAVGMAAALTGVLAAGAVLLLTTAPAAPGPGAATMPAGAGSGCAGDPASGALFGLLCSDRPG